MYSVRLYVEDAPPKRDFLLHFVDPTLEKAYMESLLDRRGIVSSGKAHAGTMFLTLPAAMSKQKCKHVAKINGVERSKTFRTM